MSKTFDVAVVGATGAVGETMMAILEERNFPVSEIRYFASSRSAGSTLPWKGRGIVAEDAAIADRAKDKFNHLRGYLLSPDPAKAFPAPDRPNIAYFKDLDQRVRAMNERGLTADLILGLPQNQLAKLLPDRASRDRLRGDVAHRGEFLGRRLLVGDRFGRNPPVSFHAE